MQLYQHLGSNGLQPSFLLLLGGDESVVLSIYVFFPSPSIAKISSTGLAITNKPAVIIDKMNINNPFLIECFITQ
jgi:hypothetical protein